LVENVCDTSRCTVLGRNGTMVSTVEHLLAACSGLGITNLLIEMDGAELPILDGSSLEFVKKIKEAGIKEQDCQREVFNVKEYFCHRHDGNFIAISPSDYFSVTTVVEFGNPLIGMQITTFNPGQESFEELIAPARTFAFKEEIEHLLEKGLAKGGTLDNAVVVDNDRYMNQLRFEDEIVRHKCLDLIGDLALMGKEIRGHVFAFKPGHKLNIEFMRELLGKFSN
jgi:UDP-3-O-[3-hydroxymyristoyl] N-acetylglucosamine deacetylase